MGSLPPSAVGPSTGMPCRVAGRRRNAPARNSIPIASRNTEAASASRLRSNGHRDRGQNGAMGEKSGGGGRPRAGHPRLEEGAEPPSKSSGG